MRILFIASFLIVNALNASRISTCGLYHGQGYLKSIDKKTFELVLDEKTLSETKVEFDNLAEATKGGLITGVNAMVVFKIEKPCIFNCKGKFVQLVSYLSPFDQNAQFYVPGFKPIKAEKCIGKK